MPSVNGFSAAQIRAAEAPHLAAGEPLMLRAAEGLAAAIQDLLATDEGRGSDENRIVVLVGPGNNGGDALYAAARLSAAGLDVRIVPVADRLHEEGLAAALEAGAVVETHSDSTELARGARVLVDGLFGIGSAGRHSVALRGPARVVVEGILSIPAERRPPVVAVDLPSGIDADSGAVPAPTVLPARLTVTFGAAKAGLLLSPASTFVGELLVVDIGIGDELAKVRPIVRASVETHPEYRAES